MTNSLLIGKLIYQLLSENLDTEKIYPLVAENGTTYPYIVYYRTNVSIQGISKDGYCEDTCNYTVATISDKYNESVEIANQIRGILEKKRIVTNDLVIFDNKLVGATERFNKDAYIQELYFECKINNQ